jgi:hypothetical protein
MKVTHWLLLALVAVTMLIVGCGGGSDTGANASWADYTVTTEPAHGTVSFADAQKLPRGTPMKVRLNRVGVEVRDYAVVFLSAFEDSGDRLILCQTTGPVQVADGDSGSPLMTTDNRVAGALAYGWDGDDHTFLARSIDDMLELPTSASSQAATSRTPVGLAYYLSGVSQSQLTRLGRLGFGNLVSHFKPADSTRSSTAATNAAPSGPIPGQPVAVHFLDGPLALAGVGGGLTYSEGDKWLLFGHAIDQAGERALPVTMATTDTVVDATPAPFKLLRPIGPVIGALIQDRTFGCVADLKAQPKTFAAKVTVGVNGGRTLDYVHQVACSPVTLAPFSGDVEEDFYALTAVLATLDHAFGKTAPGTATGELALQVEGSGVFTIPLDLPTPPLSQTASAEAAPTTPDVFSALEPVPPAFTYDIGLTVVQYIQLQLQTLRLFLPAQGLVKFELTVELDDYHP